MINYNLLKLCKELFRITIPVEIRVKEDNKGGNAAWCFPRYSGDYISKIIIVFNAGAMQRSEYCYDTVLAHEMIHAAQFLHGIMRDKHHNKNFKYLAAWIKPQLISKGYSIGELYDPEVDTS